jgi:hypothetical protein
MRRAGCALRMISKSWPNGSACVITIPWNVGSELSHLPSYVGYARRPGAITRRNLGKESAHPTWSRASEGDSELLFSGNKGQGCALHARFCDMVDVFPPVSNTVRRVLATPLDALNYLQKTRKLAADGLARPGSSTQVNRARGACECIARPLAMTLEKKACRKENSCS